MEAVLDVYKRPFDADHPVVCMDETTKQCTREVRAPIRASPGQTERYDGEYQRNGVAHLMLFYTPLENQRTVRIADNHAAGEWAEGVRQLVQEQYPDASKITLVMDNLSTHSGASLYKTFEPELAHALLQKLEFVFTPRHGSWLNMAECEFSVMARQCLDRRMADVPTLTKEITAWQNTRNQNSKPADWRFTTEDARIKLKSLYPKVSCG
jgi:transposase